MPIYESVCPRCKKVHQYWAKVADRDAAQPDCCSWPTRRILSASHVTPDIAPYRAVAADKETGQVPYIQSRKQHREFLKKNGYEEVGNDPLNLKPRTKESDASDFIWGKP